MNWFARKHLSQYRSQNLLTRSTLRWTTLFAARKEGRENPLFLKLSLPSLPLAVEREGERSNVGVSLHAGQVAAIHLPFHYEL